MAAHPVLLAHAYIGEWDRTRDRGWRDKGWMDYKELTQAALEVEGPHRQRDRAVLPLHPCRVRPSAHWMLAMRLTPLGLRIQMPVSPGNTVASFG